MPSTPDPEHQDPSTTVWLFRVRGTIRVLVSGESDYLLRNDVEDESERRIRSALASQSITLEGRLIPPPPRTLLHHRRPGAEMSHLRVPRNAGADKDACSTRLRADEVMHHVLFRAFDPSAGLTAYAKREAEYAFRSAWEMHELRQRASLRLAESVYRGEEAAPSAPALEERPVSTSALWSKRRDLGLAQLSERLAAAAALQLGDDRPQEELAAEFAITRAAFAQRVSRAVAQLNQAGFGDIAEAIRRQQAKANRAGAADDPLRALRRAGDVVELAVIGQMSSRRREEVVVDATRLVEAPLLTRFTLDAAYDAFLELFTPDERRTALLRLRAQLEREHNRYLAHAPERRDIEEPADGAYRRLLRKLEDRRRVR